ncbi:hypothetical protein LINPERPRIM_LOCUS39020 [Linum perenne]
MLPKTVGNWLITAESSWKSRNCPPYTPIPIFTAAGVSLHSTLPAINAFLPRRVPIDEDLCPSPGRSPQKTSSGRLPRTVTSAAGQPTSVFSPDEFRSTRSTNHPVNSPAGRLPRTVTSAAGQPTSVFSPDEFRSTRSTNHPVNPLSGRLPRNKVSRR